MRKVLRFFRRLFTRQSALPPAQITPVYREVNTFTVGEWRSTPELVAQAAKVLSDPAVKMMLDTLKTNHRGVFVCNGFVPLKVRATIQAQWEGYGMAIADLELLGSFQAPKPHLEETFSDPEKEENQPTE